MKHLVLVEEVPADFSIGSHDDLVALTPHASYRLDKRRQPYRIVSDFGTEEKLLEIEDAFWEEELAWFDKVDALLQERGPELKSRGIRSAVLYGYHLKSLLDNLFIRGFEIATLLRRGYDRVILWPGSLGPPPKDFLRFSLEQRGVYARLLRHICAVRAIPYEETGPPDFIREEKRPLGVLRVGLESRRKAVAVASEGALHGPSLSSTAAHFAVS